MRFGIYPGGRVGTVCSRPDDPAAVGELVDELAGANPFVIREYVHFLGDPSPAELVESLDAADELAGLTMIDDWYVQAGRELDLVVSYLPRQADVAGWLSFLDRAIDRYGNVTRHLQVTLEPNLAVPLIDGSSPGVLEALTVGIPHARSRLDQRGLHDVQLGFSVAEPAEWLGGDDAFWAYLSAIPYRDFAAYVDYVGLGLYPDAFSPVARRGTPGDAASLTAHALDRLRNHSLPIAHIPPSTPIHIAENGSPSGGPRSEQMQRDSLADMLQTTYAWREALNITHYEMFNLRDADSASAEPVATLGIVTDDYTRKPAFDVYRDFIQSIYGQGAIATKDPSVVDGMPPGIVPRPAAGRAGPCREILGS